MSNASAWYDQSTTDSGSLIQSKTSSRNKRRAEIQPSSANQPSPAIHNENELSNIGFVGQTNAGGFETNELQNNYRSVYSSEPSYAGCDGNVNIHVPSDQPWSHLSIHNERTQYLTPQRSGVLNSAPTRHDGLQYCTTPAERSLSPTVPSHLMYRGNASLENTLPSNPIYPNGPGGIIYRRNLYQADGALPTVTTTTPQALYPYEEPAYDAWLHQDGFPWLMGLSPEEFTRFMSQSLQTRTQQVSQDHVPRANASQQGGSQMLSTYRRAFQESMATPNASHASNQSITSGDDFAPQQNQQTVASASSLYSEQSGKRPIPMLQSTASSRRSDTKSRYECTRCGKMFTREDVLDRHIRTKHGGTFYRCRTCSHENCRKDKMKEHCQNHHGELRGQERYTGPHR